jgi:hypothetical protein
VAGFIEPAVFELTLFVAVEFFALVVAGTDFVVVFGCAGTVVLAAAAVPVEVCAAPAAGMSAAIPSRHTAAQLATKRALRISDQVLTRKPSPHAKPRRPGTP